MTRALITGLGGFVASHLADYLLANTDWEIYGLIRWRSDLSNINHLFDRINKRDRVHLAYGDLRDDGSLRSAVAATQPNYVFHLAAQSFPRTSFDAPIDTLETNVQGTIRLLEVLRLQWRANGYSSSASPWVHVCSSSEVYGRTAKTPIAEDAPFHPASPYAVSKVGADLMAQHYAEAYGMNIVVTRMFTHTGPRRGDVFAESSFAKQIAMAEAGQIEPVIRVGNLASVRTVADVRDAVRAYHMALTVNPVAGAVYNIGGSHTCSVDDILTYLLKESMGSYDVKVDRDRLRPIDADNQIPDCSKFKAATGWEPTISFQRTMGDLLNYWREQVKTRRFLQR